MLELKHITFEVEENGNRSKIIDDLSFQVEAGKFVVITGPNGGGKSTTARLIMGIEQPTSGQILFNGEDITHKTVTERAKLGIFFFFFFLPRKKGLTVRKLLELAHGETLKDDRCCDYLTKVGLCSKDYLDREVDSYLSGGEVKRIEIATLMARKLKLAIYDEPEAGIDLWSFTMLVNNFKHMSSNIHESVIIISHQERIMQLADEIIIIANGKIRSKGTKEEVLPQLLGEFADDCVYMKDGGITA